MSAEPRLSTRNYVFDPRPAYPYVSAVKRYWIEGSPYLNDEDAITLVLTHGTGFTKELWEPAIDDLLAMNVREGGKIKIREIWAIDSPNHGESAVLNAKEFQKGPNLIFGWEEYGRAVHLFLSGLGTGLDGVTFSKHKLVALGHSMGSVAFTLSNSYYPRINYHALVFCEVMTADHKFAAPLGDGMATSAMKRRDIWPSKEAALEFFKSRGTWKTWDARVQKLLVEHGTTPLPTVEYPDIKEGVTLTTPKIQEAACYRDVEGPYRCYTMLKHVTKQFPTHFIYGAIDDYLPAKYKADVVDNAVGGMQNLASYHRVEGFGGHLIVQSNPKGLAEQIYKALLIVSQQPRRPEIARL
ncbi:Alpha/beta hydrolase fold-1 [Panaeolus papilionaceus]|nr:Alpha/beta hydrolase fold-1 [Panaeolus papilionaceus]